jgi:hypothetical protein
MTIYWSKLGDAAPPDAWALLEALAAWADADPALPPVEPDDFLYAARVERVGQPDLHVFRHVLTRGRIEVDDDGHLWQFAGRRSGADAYMPVDSLGDALRRAELARAEQLALRTRRGARRPGWAPPPAPDEGPGDAGGQGVGDGRESSARTLSIVSASAGALSSR